jgi:glycosyltransferase involved in cell wall biosynthesis
MNTTKASVIFLSYKQERFVEAALLSALRQDFESYELIIADDASPDGTFSVIERVLAENHNPSARLKVIRQTKNLGIIGNFNSALAAASGEIFVVMAGDDISYPTRTRRMVDAFRSDPTLKSVSCACRVIDGEGKTVESRPPDLASRVYRHGRGRKDPFAGAPVTGACAAYHRSLFDIFGPLPHDANGEDVDYIFRALLAGQVMHTGETLVDYRIHGANAFNYAATAVSDAEYLSKEIRFAEVISMRDRQWRRDLTTALDAGLIDEKRACHVRKVIAQHVDRHRLFALSLGLAPMSEWWPVAKRLLAVGDLVKVAKMLSLRLFASRRSAHLAWTKQRRGR